MIVLVLGSLVIAFVAAHAGAVAEESYCLKEAEKIALSHLKPNGGWMRQRFLWSLANVSRPQWLTEEMLVAALYRLENKQRALCDKGGWCLP